MLTLYPRTAALLLAALLVSSGGSAAADPVLPASPPRAAESALGGAAAQLPSEQLPVPPLPGQQEPETRLVLTGCGPSDKNCGDGPVRPGDTFIVSFFVNNEGTQSADAVLTATLPEELTLTKLIAKDWECNGTRTITCRTFVPAGPDAGARVIGLHTRLSTDFRGSSTAVRADLQEDASPNPSERTATVVAQVEQPPPDAAGESSSPSGTASGQMLPVTGGTTAMALLALALLLLGAATRAAGARRMSPTRGA